ncbi:phage/plasmid replication protein [Pokkaliibacter sp. MBI-7]|uniref:phage/plasmid replication domain-containing protein n=1 Tax=Pokkaliibacter sp. MBI-7 TaxID=3040600 RepID=UPI00244C1E06|nr:phage/plasmid replication protein [Pokkaliibacter sp. MBI-7]MDH2435386.1 phage/plasmid replication protein [Pokkaliibacter sp. MBI-7]MDH2435393.1 phage/plasmid replication protein [Pokkaliibacter sp. MBI-7]MDH2435400.1 phage/plasmid replication protein [Pokkaliibacter sp. MBI-7]
MSAINIDWATVYQDFSEELPLISAQSAAWFDSETGEYLGTTQPTTKQEGSYSTSVQVRVSGNRVTCSGNPSRFDRLDNVIGCRTLDHAMSVFNRLLSKIGLPEFTKCTRTWILQQGSDKASTVSDGAVFQRIDINRNRAVGHGNEQAYLKGLATLRYRHSIPFLYPDGYTVDWSSKNGSNFLLYPSVYTKGVELRKHSLSKIKRRLGETSDEYTYVSKLADYCDQIGLVRFELKLYSRLLQREGLKFWGLFDESKFHHMLDDFCSIDSKLQVERMDIETISERLISSGVCSSTHAANTTANYAMCWMSGKQFDFKKRQVQDHAARLNRIGINIRLPCDITKSSPVYVKRAIEVVVSDNVIVPSWYRHIDYKPALRAVA